MIFDSTKRKQFDLKMGNRPKRYLTKEDTHRSNKYMKRCSTYYYQKNANENNNDVLLYAYQNNQNSECCNTKADVVRRGKKAPKR